jgi:hypothetical protein
MEVAIPAVPPYWMKRAFLIGSVIGAAAFVQSMVIFRLLPVRVEILELWALAWVGFLD